MIRRQFLNRANPLPGLFALLLTCFFLAHASEATKKEPSAQGYIKAAHDLYTAGRYDEAIADYTKAIKLDPKNPAYYDCRAEIYYEFENHNDKALADLNNALSLKPTFERAYLDRGDLEYQMSNLDLAITDFNKAISLNPKDALAYEGRALVNDRKRDMDRSDTKYTELAIRDYSKAISLYSELAARDPSKATSLRSYYQFALSHRADDYMDLKQFSLAMADYNRIAALSPHDSTGDAGIAFTYFNAHDYARAIPAFQKVAKSDPYDSQIWMTLGQSQYHVGDYSGAIDSYKKALSLHDKYLTRILNFEIGLTYAVDGNSVQAEMYCQRGIALASQDEMAIGVNEGEQMLKDHPQSQALQTVLKKMQAALAAKGPMKYGFQTSGAN